MNNEIMTKDELIHFTMDFAKTKHENAGQNGYFDKHIMHAYNICMQYLLDFRLEYDYGDYYDYFLSKETSPDKAKIDLCKRNYTSLLVGILLHDVLEDTDATKDELENIFGYEIMMIVYNVTDGEGKNRKERKLNTYWKTRRDADSVVIKLIDRIANVEAAGQNKKDPAYLDMYKKEYYNFKCALWNGPFDDNTFLWRKLDELHGVSNIY